MDLFDRFLCVASADIQLMLTAWQYLPWADFFLNPRRLRGSDFLMRWSQGTWSEERLIDAVNDTARYFALPYGPSSVAPADDVRALELYFDRLEAAGLGEHKRPDLLIFQSEHKNKIKKLVDQLGGVSELPFVPEDHLSIRQLLETAIVAAECENSLWVAKQMPDYGAALKPMRRLGGQLGLRKGAVVPTVILKEEDRMPLKQWQQIRGVKIHLWHVFYDMAFGLSFDRAEELITSNVIQPTVQIFQAPGGATTRKTIFKIYYHYAYELAESKEEPKLVPDCIVDKNGHVLPYVKFEGGQLQLNPEILQTLDAVSDKAMG